MKQIVLNGNEIVSEQQLHRLLAQALDLPEWYGGNLDALFDCLTDVAEDTEILLTEADGFTDILLKPVKLETLRSLFA